MVILLIVGKDGNLGIAGVIQGLSQKGAVVGQSAVSDIFGHGHAHMIRVVGPASQGPQNLTDDNLGGEADIIVHILLSEAYGFRAADLQRDGPHSLGPEHCRHHHGKCVGCVGHQYRLGFDVLFCEFSSVGIREGVRSCLSSLLPPHDHRLHKGADPDSQRSSGVALIQLQHQRGFSGYAVHDPDDLIGEIGIMAAAEAHGLNIFQRIILRSQDRGAEHPSVIIVYHIQTAQTQVRLLLGRQGICRQHRDAEGIDEFRQVVIDQRVVLIGPGSQNHAELSPRGRAVHGLRGSLLQRSAEFLHGPVTLKNGVLRLLWGDSEGFLHPARQLVPPVRVRVPVPQRRVEGNAEEPLRIVGIPDNDGIALNHGAHGFTCLLCVLRFDGRNAGHEDSVRLHGGQGPEMSVNQLCGETDSIRGDGGDAGFIESAAAWGRYHDPEAETSPEGGPEGHGIPEGQDSRHTDGHALFSGDRNCGIVLKQQLFPQAEQIRNPLPRLIDRAELFPCGFFFRVSQDLPALAAVVGNPGGAV